MSVIPLFLIHGWNMPSTVWQSVTEHLQRDLGQEVEIHWATLPGYPRMQPRETAFFRSPGVKKPPSIEESSSSGLEAVNPLAQAQVFFDQMTDDLLEQAPPFAHWCGWSLGATLAMQAALRSPARIERLTLISPTPKFTSSQDWPHGMPAAHFEKLLRVTCKRFEAGWDRFLRWQLPAETSESQAERWKGSLMIGLNEPFRPADAALIRGKQVLCEIDLRDRLKTICMPTKVIGATEDQVVPIAASQFVAKGIPNSQFVSLAGGHGLPFTRPDEVAMEIEVACNPTHALPERPDRVCLKANMLRRPVHDLDPWRRRKTGMSIDKHQVARQFSRSAPRYEAVAELQSRMAMQLAEWIEPGRQGHLIDLGCGTGQTLRHLSRNRRWSRLTGIDLAPGMIEQAQRHFGLHLDRPDVINREATDQCDTLDEPTWTMTDATRSLESRPTEIQFICADIESLPVANNLVDVALSNAALQWTNLTVAFPEVARILKPGGQFLFTTFGPRTLNELDQAIQHLEPGRVRVHQFPGLATIQRKLSESGFRSFRSRSEMHTEYFSDVRALLNSVRQLGATYAGVDRKTSYFGRQKYRQLLNSIAEFTDHQGKFKLTYELLFVSGVRSD